MKVFVATHDGQGARDTDFCWTTDGEVVEWAMACDADDESDGGCGCQRAMAGLSSAKATTTFKVAELPLTQRDYIKAVRESYDRRWRSLGLTRRQCAAASPAVHRAMR